MHFNCQAPVLGTRALHLFGIQDWPLKDAAHTNAQQLLHRECCLAKQSILEKKHLRQCQLLGEGGLFCWVFAREASQYEPPPPSLSLKVSLHSREYLPDLFTMHIEAQWVYKQQHYRQTSPCDDSVCSVINICSTIIMFTQPLLPAWPSFLIGPFFIHQIFFY